MGSRYGLLLASGARRYCRTAIRATLVLPFSFLFRRYSFLLARLSRSPSTGMVVYGAMRRRGIGWLGIFPFDAILGPARGYRAPKMYSTVAGMLEKGITFSFSAFLYLILIQKDVFMSLMKKIAIA